MLYDFIYIWNLKKKPNERNKIETVIVTENEQVVARGEMSEGRKDIGEGDLEVQDSSRKMNEPWV